MLLKQSAPLRMIVLSPAKRPRIAPDRHIRTIVGPSSLSVEDELAQAKIAWKRYQSTRERDAIYDYLRAVFKIVRRWRKESRVKASSHQALACFLKLRTFRFCSAVSASHVKPWHDTFPNCQDYQWP